MKWLAFDDHGTVRHGRIDGDEVVVTGDGDLAGVVAGAGEEPERFRVPLAGLTLVAPLTSPGKVIAVTQICRPSAGAAPRVPASAFP